MRRVRRLPVVVAALAAAPVAGGAAPSLTLAPPSVQRGHVVAIRGSADGCAAGNTVFVLSRAFVRAHAFAGVPVVLARVAPGGSFRATTRIPTAKAPGRYAVTARCGGGNLGVLVRLRVRR